MRLKLSEACRDLIKLQRAMMAGSAHQIEATNDVRAPLIDGPAASKAAGCPRASFSDGRSIQKAPHRHLSLVTTKTS
jgi:hypothetical protein